MPFADSDSVKLYYEEAGRGVPIVFVHEFSGDFHSWEAQMRHFSRRYRCVAYNARGYRPSDVPPSPSKYSQKLAIDDIVSVMRHADIGKAHIIGCSMGAYATLNFGLRFPRRALSLTAVGAGSGSDPYRRRQFLLNNSKMARLFEEKGMPAAVKAYQVGPARIQLAAKDPRGYREFWARFAQHSALGHACTLRGLQRRRPTIYDLEPGLARLKVPTHVVVGDEDDACLDPSLFIKRVCPAARLTVVPATGHVVNVEEPDFFNRITEDFLNLVDSGRWRPRDPRSYNPSTMARR
ncbi:MAG: alpha/beta hydrolase [Betaproteobacteria bacterium]|nr:alpha/beta hydrolase [Betaproteobacteria bacterium]